MDKQALFDQIKGGLIVSCQALEHEPLYTKEGGIMPLMAKAAAQSGAVGIRANTVRDITQIKEAVDLPVIGIIKKDYEGTPMYITVTMKEVDELVACGVDILAVQGTSALRPDGSTAAQFIEAIKAKYPEQLVMADCATIEEGIACANAGADFVGTTMRGYTPETQGCDDIDFDFIHDDNFFRFLAIRCPEAFGRIRFLVLLHKAADIADEHLRCPFAAEHIALDRQIIAAGVAPFGVAVVIVVVLAGTVYVPYLLNGLLGIQPQLVHHAVELELRVAADEDADAVRIIC